ncbi:MAG: sigma 54-interacting transcriptional regulator [Kiritimatiellae bacterium]|nr:sigma 54-interacting transcriptional regulator [Kiritimatiellia bacterium]MDD5520029.1 sigma 54-interacting transcriptional regulator [Kiritimatiellia bacterium]
MENDRRVKKIDGPTLVISADKTRNAILVQKSKLLAISGPLQGKEFMVDKNVYTIGSGPNNNLVLEDSTISRRHCEIQLGPEGYVIRDLGSTNGTVVQGVKVSEAYLNQSTEIQLGKTKVVFCPLKEAMEYTLSQNESFGRLLGKSVSMRRVFHVAETYAPTDATILIEGDTGTGKEVLAEEIHKHSTRKDKPFIVIDCASLAKELIESELFGHTKGSFTGANIDRTGAFEYADGGTVFLDEIGDLSGELQPKLLRVLEKKEIRKVGSNKLRNIDVRIISATNRKLESEVNAGRFREDLYFRLSVVNIDLAPLRNRKDDIPMLAKHFMKEFFGSDAMDQIADFEKTMEAFKTHDWPGNVRELRNLIEMASYNKQRPINLSSFLYLGKMKTTAENSRDLDSEMRPFKDAKGDLVEKFERDYISALLKRNDGNVSKASREAGIERAYLQRLIKRYDLKT